jgi:fibronectin-binding autotransporter adhesin
LTVTGTNGFGSTAADTTVASGASVHIDRSGEALQSYSEAFNLSGTGVSNSGALQATGAVTLTGAINLNADTRIVTNSGGTLVISNTTTGIDGSSGNYNLTLAGAGDMTVSGPINLGTGTLTKGVSGTLTLSGALTAGGVTDLNRATISANVTTSGNQTYSGGADIGPGNITLTSNTGNVTFSDTVRGSGTANVSIAGNLVLNSGANVESSVTSLSVSGTTNLAANVTTANTQTYTGATALSAASTLTTTNSNITFSNTINSSNSTARNLTINTGSGTTQFAGIIGGTNALGAIGITGNVDLDAAITGASSLSVSGTSNLGANVTTTGVQSYSGTTTLSGSDRTLQGSTITLAAVTGGSNSLTITGNLDLDGAISGVDDLSVSGTSDIGADVTTTGTQTYSGTTTLSTSSTLEGSTVNLNAVTGGSNALTVTGNLDLDGVISGVTNLSVSGTSNIGANITTTGTQTYTAVTTLSTDATLTGTAITASVVSLGTNDLTISNSAASAINGAVTGTGGLTKAGSGALTMSNASTYTGETTINAGTLTVTGTLSDSADVIVASGATYDVDENDTVKSVTGLGSANVASSKTLTLSSSDNGSTSTVFSGSGNLTKSGTGTLTFLGESTISGDVTVSNGTLYAGNASSSTDTIFNTDVTVNGSNAVLGGGGIIAGNVTVTNGTIAPGNSIGTLYVSGDLDLTANSTTNIEFNNEAADKIVIGIGSYTTSLGGTISLYPEDDTYETKSHIIIDASNGGTFTGNFSTERINNESNLNGASWDIVYDTTAKTVSLDLTAAASSPCNINCTTTVSGFKDIAKVFDNATSGKFKEIKDVLDAATINSVNTELSKLEGTVFASAYAQPTMNHGYFNRALNSVTSSNVSTSLVSSFANHTDELTLASLQDAGLYGQKDKFNEYYDYSDTSVLGFIKNNKNKSILDNFVSEDRASFIRTYGTTADRDNIGSSYTGYKSETTGILFGQQFKNDDVTFSGYSYGFTGTDTDYKNNYGESKTYSAHASLFRQIDKEDFGLNLISGMYVSKTESERNVTIFGTSVNDKYLSDYWDVGFNQEVQFIKKFNIAGLNLAPSAKLNSTYVVKSDTKETGGDLALTIDNENLFIVKPEIGLSIARDFNQSENITNEFSVAVFASQDHFLEGTTSNARFTSGSSFNVDMPRDEETYYSIGLGYNFLDSDNNSSLMANAFLMQNEHDDMESNIFSFTYRKLFGDFGKGRIPPVIAKKSDNEDDIVIIDIPESSNDGTIKEGEKSLEELEKNIEIVLKDNPTEEEVDQVYKSMSESLVAKRKLTVNDVYKNLAANCYAVENKLVELVNYYNKLQLYKILDRCNKLSEPKVHLIAERLHQIQLDETTKLQELYYGYLRFLNYIPFITFIAFIILAYEFVRRYIIDYFKSKKAI